MRNKLVNTSAHKGAEKGHFKPAVGDHLNKAVLPQDGTKRTESDLNPLRPLYEGLKEGMTDYSRYYSRVAKV